MKVRCQVIFDGEVLRPQGLVNLELNKAYTVTIEEGEDSGRDPVVQSETSDIFAFVLEHAEDLGVETSTERPSDSVGGTLR